MSREDLLELRTLIRRNYLVAEADALGAAIAAADLPSEARREIVERATELVRKVRAGGSRHLMEAFLAEYGLSTAEGVALMCLAEALLRVPDAATMDELIRDKIAPHDWSAHSGGSASMFVNASTWALMLTGRVLDEGEGTVERTLRGMIRRMGEPVIRSAVAAAMRELGEQFVLGETIRDALENGRKWRARGYLYSYDMLGEAARTHADAQRYFDAYAAAIGELAAGADSDDIRRNPGISVKLSALHPRYEQAKRETCVPLLVSRLTELCLAAKTAGMGLNVDAEEADRLDLSLEIMEAVISDPRLSGWDGFGIVVQAYGRRALPLIDWIAALAGKHDRRLMVRLVKGAYWDSEIKRAQVLGLADYPVFTRKAHTDISYLACARRLLSNAGRLYPQFATHNAHTVSGVLHMAREMGVARGVFEFQRLHGMGDALHEEVRGLEGTSCRIYAPVGAHEDLLAYLVRRLLENGANSSFVHQIVDENVAPETVARDPFVAAEAPAANPAIVAPSDIFLPQRLNSRGWDLSDPDTLHAFEAARRPFEVPFRWDEAASDGVGDARTVRNPANPDEPVGAFHEAEAATVHDAVARGAAAHPAWAGCPVEERATILRRAADLFEAHAGEFFALCAREAGKTPADAVSELREAVDFLRYYASGAAKAEQGTKPRGVIACISPWNFPLAVFTGQVAAALVTGNAVIAKPAEQTPLIALRAVALLHEAGVPRDVLQLLPGEGETVGAALTADPDIAGVCFTGSTQVARAIERHLAATAAPDAMLIAETGGINAMIVDSTALPEQAVRDILASAFQSAGQRCSALRILYVQEDAAERVLAMLKGAMDTLSLGDPWLVSTDVGPVIDAEAREELSSYCRAMEAKGSLLAKLEAPADGLFVAPHIFRVEGIEELEREIFGPVLHVATFANDEIEKVISRINQKGYGLTFGIHTRIDERVQRFVDRIHAGNIYVNRNQIGAVVGAQPFGGEGLSGTGPKAGGPLYLNRFRKHIDPADEKGSLPFDDEIDFPAKLHPRRAEWAIRPDRVTMLRKLLRGRGGDALSAAAAFDFGPIDLPGPTGEANSWFLAPRGRVVALGPTPERLLDQVVQALCAGNEVVAVMPGAVSILRPLATADLPLAIVEKSVSETLLRRGRFDAVACGSDAAGRSRLRRALAERDGPLVRLIDARFDPSAYCVERSVCVDTTAAGGNASLLAAAE